MFYFNRGLFGKMTLPLLWPSPCKKLIFKVLKDKELANLLLTADNDKVNPFDKWSKFQILIQQGRTPEGIKWVFFALHLVYKQICFQATNQTNMSLIKCSMLCFLTSEVHWIIPVECARYDGVKSGYLTTPTDITSCRSLQGLTCKILLAQKTCLDLLMEKMETDFTDWPAGCRKSIRDHSANHRALRETLGTKIKN